MLNISGYCLLQGISFSPSQLERETSFMRRQHIELGQLGLSGKYAGIPVPFGSAIVDFKNHDNVDMIMVDSTVADGCDPSGAPIFQANCSLNSVFRSGVMPSNLRLDINMTLVNIIYFYVFRSQYRCDK